jgi:dTDP-4-amino-4,6-dideoxygalactose transaminase
VTKNLSSVEGGAIVTDRAEVAEFARPFRLHGMSKDALDRYKPGHWSQYDLMGPGIKANLPDVLAAMARTQLSRFAEMQAVRRQLVQRYRQNLGGFEGLRFVPSDLASEGADHLLVVALRSGEHRAGAMAALDEAGIGYSVHFQPLHRFSWFQANAEVGPLGVVGAESMADRVLSLPMSSVLAPEDIDRVCDVLRDITR